MRPGLSLRRDKLFSTCNTFFAACQVRWRTGCAFCVCVVWDRGRVIFLQKVQSFIGLRRTQLIVQSCSNSDFSSEGSEFYWVRNMYNLSGCFRSSKSGVLDCMIYWVACAGHRSLPRWCPTAASVSLHPSSTPQGRPRYHVVVVALLLHLQVQKRQQQRFAVRCRLRRQDHFPLEIVLIYVFLLPPIEEKKGQHRATVATACFSLHNQFGRYQEEDKERKL
ncbi:hypothetical protein VPH35_103563 [Triticum aestivum]